MNRPTRKHPVRSAQAAFRAGFIIKAKSGQLIATTFACASPNKAIVLVGCMRAVNEAKDQKMRADLLDSPTYTGGRPVRLSTYPSIHDAAARVNDRLLLEEMY